MAQRPMTKSAPARLHRHSLDVCCFGECPASYPHTSAPSVEHPIYDRRARNPFHRSNAGRRLPQSSQCGSTPAAWGPPTDLEPSRLLVAQQRSRSGAVTGVGVKRPRASGESRWGPAPGPRTVSCLCVAGVLQPSDVAMLSARSAFPGVDLARLLPFSAVVWPCFRIGDVPTVAIDPTTISRRLALPAWTT